MRRSLVAGILIAGVGCGEAREDRAPGVVTSKSTPADAGTPVERPVGSSSGTGPGTPAFAECGANTGLRLSEPLCAFPGPKNVETATCAVGCSVPLEALQWDEEQHCRRKVIVGCVPMPADGFQVGDMRTCFKNDQDGRVIGIDTARWALPLSSSTWGKCTQEEAFSVDAHHDGN